MDNTTFVGRKSELDELNALLHKKTASLIVIKGRRRIGKTRLIEEFAKGKKFFRFTGLAPDKGITAQTQRNEFSYQLSRQTGLPEIQVDDWSKLFSLLAEKSQSGRCIIFLDEITWMAHGDPTFLSKLKNAWEIHYKKNPKLILVLCGSFSAWIEKNILSSTGYFARISKKITLHELPINRCNQLLESIGFKRSSYEKLLYLSLTGGIPWYVELINPKRSADDNIKSLCFEPDGILVDEHRHIFHDLFGKRSGVYEKITQYLADKPGEYQDLVEGADYTSSGLFSEYLDDLIESGYISKNYSWDFKTGKPKSTALYRLSDNYLRFYYKYILPKMNQIKKGQYRDVQISSLPGWNGIMGFQFETLVRQNRKIILNELGIAPEQIVYDDPYFQRKTKRHLGCQIDYLVQTKLNSLFVCEVKFHKEELNTKVIHEVKEKIERLAKPRNFTFIPVLIHANGVKDSVLEAEYFYKVIDFSYFLRAE